MNGFLLIDKPSGISSAGCVYKLRKVLKISKIGHCGTLDPLATGVLPLCIGEATKFSNYISDQSKEYEVEILFGIQTTTGDLEGEEIFNEPFKIDELKLEKTIKKFLGTQSQVPPMYSAIKINGNPLYYWARKGVYFKRKVRQIHIDAIGILASSNTKATLRISCTKGTYVRSLVEDIGVDLSTRATVINLRRTKVGPIGEESLVELGASIEEFKSKLVAADQLLNHLPSIQLNEIDAKKIRNGRTVDYNADLDLEGLVRIYQGKSLFIGLGSIDSSSTVSAKRLLSYLTN
jgi:tRNA pseudouridine55 synthase